MALTFTNLIDHNKRISLFLIVGIIVVISALGALVFGVVFSPSSQVNIDGIRMGAITGAGFAVVGSLISYFFGGSVITSLSNARRVDHLTDPELVNTVEEMAIAAGLPPPAIYVIDDSAPNAFASGRDPKHALIAITTGLRSKLTRDELQAVIAHEMAHINNYDIRLMMLVAVFAGIVVLLSDLGRRRLFNTLHLRGRKHSGNSSTKVSLVVLLIEVALFLVLFWLAPLITRILQFAISREREYLADATAIKFCRNPTGLINALKKIATDPEPLESANRATEHLYIVNPDVKKKLRADHDSVWSTHPPLIKRIARIRGLTEGGH